MDYQLHEGKQQQQISQEFPTSETATLTNSNQNISTTSIVSSPTSGFQRSQEFVNFSVFPIVNDIMNDQQLKQFSPDIKCPNSPPMFLSNSIISPQPSNNTHDIQLLSPNLLQPTMDQSLLIKSPPASTTNLTNSHYPSKEINNTRNVLIDNRPPKQFQDVLIPVTSSGKDGSLFTVLENVPIKRTHRRRSANVDKDSLKCYQCNTSNTPEWRKGPEGPATLCNACGLAYAKKQKLGNHGKNVKLIAPSNPISSVPNTTPSISNTIAAVTASTKRALKTSTTVCEVPTNRARGSFGIDVAPVVGFSSTTGLHAINESPTKKSHTFHQYMTPPNNSFFSGKPIKSKSAPKPQKSKSKLGKLTPTKHEQPQLNEQVQAVMEKNNLLVFSTGSLGSSGNSINISDLNHDGLNNITNNSLNIQNNNSNDNNIVNQGSININQLKSTDSLFLFQHNHYQQHLQQSNNHLDTIYQHQQHQQIYGSVIPNCYNFNTDAGIDLFSNAQESNGFEFSTNVPNLSATDLPNSMISNNLISPTSTMNQSGLFSSNDQNSFVPVSINCNDDTSNNNNNDDDNSNDNICYQQNSNNNNDNNNQINPIPVNNSHTSNFIKTEAQPLDFSTSLPMNSSPSSEDDGNLSQSNISSSLSDSSGSSPTDSFSGLSVNTPYNINNNDNDNNNIFNF